MGEYVLETAFDKRMIFRASTRARVTAGGESRGKKKYRKICRVQRVRTRRVVYMRDERDERTRGAQPLERLDVERRAYERPYLLSTFLVDAYTRRPGRP